MKISTVLWCVCGVIVLALVVLGLWFWYGPPKIAFLSGNDLLIRNGFWVGMECHDNFGNEIKAPSRLFSNDITTVKSEVTMVTCTVFHGLGPTIHAQR